MTHTYRISLVCLVLSLGALVSAASSPTDVSGQWHMTFKSRDGATYSRQLIIQQIGEKISTTFKYGDREFPLTGVFDGSWLHLSGKQENETIRLDGHFDENGSLLGTMKFQRMATHIRLRFTSEARWTAERDQY